MIVLRADARERRAGGHTAVAGLQRPRPSVRAVPLHH